MLYWYIFSLSVMIFLIIGYLVMDNFTLFKLIQGLKLMQYLNQSDETWRASVPCSDILRFMKFNLKIT